MYTSDKSFISNNGRNINNKTDANITIGIKTNFRICESW